MKFIVILFCIVLTMRFVYNISRMNNYGEKSWKWFVKAMSDAFLIIAFAIIEKGRW